jgi:hypothetical protein
MVGIIGDNEKGFRVAAKEKLKKKDLPLSLKTTK